MYLLLFVTHKHPHTIYIDQRQNSHELSDDYNPLSCSLSGGNPCDPCSELVDLNIEICHIQRQLTNLLQKRVSLKTKINHRHDCLIHGVPLEIASHIFGFYHERSLSPVHFSLESRKAPLGPLILSRVCNKWKQIVYSTPQLWTSVHIYSDRSYTTPLDKIRQRLRRSGQLPLSISLFCVTSSSALKIIDFLKELAPRWGVLQLLMDPPSTLHFLIVSPGPLIWRNSVFIIDLRKNPIHLSNCATHLGFAMFS